MALFTIDGKSYSVFIEDGGLSRSGQILDGENAGRLKNGRMIRDVIGTYYNYSLNIDTQQLNATDYDALYETLTAPVDYHTVSFPYGQGVLTFDAYVSGVEDVLQHSWSGANRWGGMKVNFIAMAPQRR